jgi:hypothetical protein
MFWIKSGQHVNISLEKQETNLFFRHWWHAVPSPGYKSSIWLLISECISMPWNACNFGAWVQWSDDIYEAWCQTPQTRWQCHCGSKQVPKWQCCINQWCQYNKWHDVVLHCLLIQLFFSHNSDTSQQPEYKLLLAKYKPWSASLCNFLSCSANLLVWDQILAYTESQKVVTILNVYTVNIPQLLHWYCNSNKVQESVFREKHIQCVWPSHNHYDFSGDRKKKT